MRVWSRVALLFVFVLCAPILMADHFRAECPLSLVDSTQAATEFDVSPHGVFRNGNLLHVLRGNILTTYAWTGSAFVVPSAVAKSTFVVNAVDPVFVTANENVELPAFPSAAVTSAIANEAELSSSETVCVELGVSITKPGSGTVSEMATVNVSFVSATVSPLIRTVAVFVRSEPSPLKATLPFAAT